MTVSAIIPAYNAELYLQQCIDSVCGQTYTDFELIIVDDGSTDETPIIIDRIAAEDNRVVVVHQVNAGPGVARNAGINLARGDYLLFLDSDDKLASPTVLASMVERAKTTGCDVLLARACSMGLHGEPGNELAWCLRKDLVPEYDPFSPDDVGAALFYISGTVPWGKLFRRELISREKLRFPPLARSEDFPFVQTAIACAGKIAVFDDVMVLHRTGREDSLEGTKDSTPLIFVEAESIFFKMLEERGMWQGFSVAAKARALLRLSYNVDAMCSIDAAEKVFEQLNRLLDRYRLPDGFCEVSDVVRIMKRLETMMLCGSAKVWRLHRGMLLKLLDAQQHRDLEVTKKLKRYCDEINLIRSSFVYRVGMFVTWPARKAWGGVKCLRENGVKYTVKHAAGKVLRLCGATCKW